MALFILLFLFLQNSPIEIDKQADIKNDSLANRQLIESVINEISASTHKTSLNTEPTLLTQTDIDEYLTIILSIIAAVGTILTVYTIKMEIEQQTIGKKFQEKILIDLIRHLYRNKVCLSAISWKLHEKGINSFYPSEEHLLKLKVLPEDIRIERFSNTPDKYDILHELELKFRNYNIEIDVTIEHLKSERIDNETKIRDLRLLEFKCQYLTKEITSVLSKLDYKLSYVLNETTVYDDITAENIKKYLTSISNRYDSDNEIYANIKNVPNRMDDSRINYYDKELHMTETLDMDICGEVPKISLIKL